MQACWEQAFLWALEAEQAEDVTVESGGFRECGKPRGILSLVQPNTIGVTFRDRSPLYGQQLVFVVRTSSPNVPLFVLRRTK